MIKEEPKFNIICFSNQLWTYPLWTNKKHVMSRMAAKGHNVIFVDPPINVARLFLRQLLAGKWPLKRLLTGRTQDGTVEIFSPLNTSYSLESTAKVHSTIINKIAKKKFDPKRKTIIWIYHVELAGLSYYLKNIKHDLLVYDCVDNYAGFPKYNTPAKRSAIVKQETYLTKKADIVFATAPGLVDRLAKINKNTHFTPNVGDYEHFIKVDNFKNDLPEDLANIPRPRIGFSGALDEYKFDKALFKQAVENYLGYSFVVIGPMALQDREATNAELGFDKLNNVYFLGTKNYKDMPKYYAGFDVLLIPYQLNDYTVGGCFPVKFHDGLAAGLPVVVTDLPAYRPFADVCYISKSYNEFSQNIRRALDEDTPQKKKERQKVAKENNWDGKVDKMLKLVKAEVFAK